ncbi:unnamed protein product [Fraxinus pennsylvanica]|uniref:J domain-containing protein n=1 Tax=Fraxinus pennsylvanica TaxID=56036 RepID=A0AAD1ZSK7_9LAMI|nr:unnamed protein product [Fraxinus pennsylvanica]
MECNRDEALRAKTIAEDKLEEKDFAGARKFALKARILYPGLEGIAQLLTTLDVCISSENKTNGEVDWYGVLGVNPSCDDETIRKQYRKLALLLHPDKNNIVGADRAFKLLSEAWSLLSDTAKRFAYNQRRGCRGVQQKVPMHAGGPSAASCANGYHNVARRTTSVLKTKNNGAKTYLNQTLLCPNCHKAFLASEAASPLNSSKSSNPAPSQRYQNSSNCAPSQNAFDRGRNAAAAKTSGPGQADPNSFKHASFRQDSLSGTVGVSGKDPSFTTKAANVVKQVQQKLKREHTESNAPTDLEGDIIKQKLDKDGYHYGMNNYVGRENGGFGRPDISRIYHFPGTYRTPSNTVNRESKKITESKREKDKRTHSGKVGLSSVVEELEDKRHVSCSADNADKKNIMSLSLHVPDPDFHDFDKDRSESSFGDNEVWAAYDDDNNWVGSGFYKTCGEFRIGRYEICTSINSFSQKVVWSKGPRGTIQIFPKKSDVWALFKNWSSDWNERTSDEVIHSYDMVMVLDDYKEEGVSVAPLVKVIGFKTVFRPNLEPEMVNRIPKEEMFRFSHQVPYHLLTGQEGQNAPRGCLELDPAATPLELLQVIAESHEVPVIPNEGEIKR